MLNITKTYKSVTKSSPITQLKHWQTLYTDGWLNRVMRIDIWVVRRTPTELRKPPSSTHNHPTLQFTTKIRSTSRLNTNAHTNNFSQQAPLCRLASVQTTSRVHNLTVHSALSKKTKNKILSPFHKRSIVIKTDQRVYRSTIVYSYVGCSPSIMQENLKMLNAFNFENSNRV